MSQCHVTIDGVWIGQWTHCTLIHTTRKYKQLQRHSWSPHFYKSPLHPLSLFQLDVFSPAIPWQRLLTVVILQLLALRSFLRRLSFRTASQLFPQLNWILVCSETLLQSSTKLSTQLSNLNSLLLQHRTNRIENMVSNNISIVARVLVFTEPLPSNGRFLWFHYSGFQASCHSNNKRIHPAGWSNSNEVDLGLWGVRFEFRPWHQLCWQISRSILQALQAKFGIVSRLEPYHLLLDSFKVIIHQSS
jgi:hypothetical protein